ncbi:MAG: transketolase [Armatimonadetes bacterium]|nr:transketolase [Armatimonadota bacterium]
MPAQSIAELTETARRVRKEIILMTTAAGSGHPSSSFSCTEIVCALYFGGLLRHDPGRPDWPERDRFILSKGHACPAQYAAMALAGYFPESELASLRKLGSPLEGHPNVRRLPGIEASTGSLGQGLSLGLGMALAARLDGADWKTWVVLGDGEINEGQIWEAALAAAKFGTDNLIAIVDANTAQQTGYTRDVLNTEPKAEKWAAFGWETQEVDGHDYAALLPALQRARAGSGRPQAIVARTLKGKGVSFVEREYGYHGKPLTAEESQRALKELGWT